MCEEDSRAPPTARAVPPAKDHRRLLATEDGTNPSNYTERIALCSDHWTGGRKGKKNLSSSMSSLTGYFRRRSRAENANKYRRKQVALVKQL